MRARERVELGVVEKMCIDLGRDVDASMAELLRDCDQGNALGEPNACRGMPESMDRDERLAIVYETGSALNALEKIARRVFRHRPTVLPRPNVVRGIYDVLRAQRPKLLRERCRDRDSAAMSAFRGLDQALSGSRLPDIFAHDNAPLIEEIKTQAVATARKALAMGSVAVFAANKRGNQGCVGLAEELLSQLALPLTPPIPLQFVGDTASLQAAHEYLLLEYGADWVGTRALEAGAVLHHGDIPQETREVVETLLRDEMFDWCFAQTRSQRA